jgi:hypothetical protein
MSSAFPSRRATSRGGALAAVLVAVACAGDDAARDGSDAPQPAEVVASPTDTAGSGVVPSLSPASGAAGTRVTLTASGLPPGLALEIGFGAPMQNFEVLAQATVDAQGSLSSVVTVPSWAEAGRAYHFVMAPVNQPPLGLSRPFQVTAR